MKPLYFLTHFTLKCFFKFFYHHEIFGLENLPKRSAIIAANHNSFLDPPLLGTSCPEEICYFAKSSLFKHFLLGSLISRLNAYPVEGTALDLASFKQIIHLLENKKKVLIFPEGMRSPDGSLCSFKPGLVMLAMRSNAPIIPVYLHGTFDIWDRMRTFPKLKGRTACIFGKPIEMPNYQNLSKKEAQKNISEELKKAIEDLRTWYLMHCKRSN